MNGVSKITVTEDVTLVTFNKVYADLKLIADIFADFAKADINIDMISQTAPQGHYIDLSFSLPADQLIKVLELINKFRETHAQLKPMVSSGNCKIQLYGQEMREMHGVAAAAISAIASTQVGLTLITTSEVDISLLVTQADCNAAVKSLEEMFHVKAE
ncbi:ACT domain-containing protein [Youxingia wuxianensis]|uniref:aspartate kinase n=1 Tax=Youxingia wuxianensis TaxID=2763678 RepID=A0A926EL38_9FIRM|nr:ACT domain-containing protein [Youxingia wuxianensis]MBC8584360.1 ACT domain-containing protein [Youxingia wuxianensis]